MIMNTLWASCAVLVCILACTTVGNPGDTLTPNGRSKRIIGGTDVMRFQWPSLAQIKLKVPRGVRFLGGYDSYQLCGASIIHKRWVLTAAHCLSLTENKKQYIPAEYLHIKAGEIEREHGVWDKIAHFAGKVTSNDDLLLWVIQASKVVVHPQYDPANRWKHDIALIKLEKDLPIGTDPDIAAMTLPSQGSMWPNDARTTCVMKGWGCLTAGGHGSQIAKAVTLPIVDSNTCRNYHGDIGNTRICAGYELGRKGICKGDSGGPLVCQNANSQWIQVGIASYTSKDYPGHFPGVFTRVSQYRYWIEQTIRNN